MVVVLLIRLTIYSFSLAHNVRTHKLQVDFSSRHISVRHFVEQKMAWRKRINRPSLAAVLVWEERRLRHVETQPRPLLSVLRVPSKKTREVC